MKLHRVQALSARVQTRSCVNLGEQNRIWVAPEVHRKLAFGAVTFVTAQQFSSIFLIYPKSIIFYS